MLYGKVEGLVKVTHWLWDVAVNRVEKLLNLRGTNLWLFPLG